MCICQFSCCAWMCTAWKNTQAIFHNIMSGAKSRILRRRCVTSIPVAACCSQISSQTNSTSGCHSEWVSRSTTVAWCPRKVYAIKTPTSAQQRAATLSSYSISTSCFSLEVVFGRGQVLRPQTHIISQSCGILFGSCKNGPKEAMLFLRFKISRKEWPMLILFGAEM